MWHVSVLYSLRCLSYRAVRGMWHVSVCCTVCVFCSTDLCEECDTSVCIVQSAFFCPTELYEECDTSVCIVQSAFFVLQTCARNVTHPLGPATLTTRATATCLSTARWAERVSWVDRWRSVPAISSGRRKSSSASGLTSPTAPTVSACTAFRTAWPIESFWNKSLTHGKLVKQISSPQFLRDNLEPTRQSWGNSPTHMMFTRQRLNPHVLETNPQPPWRSRDKDLIHMFWDKPPTHMMFVRQIPNQQDVHETNF